MKRAQLILFSLFFSTIAFAQTFPSKPIRIIVPAAPGGSSDLEARVYAPKMSELLGQPVILDYKGGAGGVVGTKHVAQSAADGYNILLVTSSFTISQADPSPPFDVLRDFSPISLMSYAELVFIVAPHVPAQGLKEYIAYAKANPDKLNYGVTGLGSTNHMAGAWLHSITGVKATYVPFKGMSPIMLDMIAGRIDASVANLSVALPYLKDRRLRALAILGDKRSTLTPDVPTVMEQGIRDYNYTNRLGFVAPAKTPNAVVTRLGDAFAKVSKMPDVVNKFNGVVMVGSTPEYFRKVLESEIDRWRKVAKEAGIQVKAGG